MLPPWIAEGGKTYENLRDPAMRAKIRAATEKPDGTWESMGDLAGPEGVMPVSFARGLMSRLRKRIEALEGVTDAATQGAGSPFRVVSEDLLLFAM